MANFIHLFVSVLLLFTFITPTLSSDNVLYSSTYGFTKGSALAYRDYRLTLASDCNLILSGHGSATLWQVSPPFWFGQFVGCSLKLTSHGELVLDVYLAFYKIWSWSSGVKSEKGDYALVINYDGSLKIYGKSIWSSSSNKTMDYYKHSEDPLKYPYKIPVEDSTFWSGDVAPIGTIIVNYGYELELGMTCNMTLTDTQSKRVLWHTNTIDITRDCFVNLEANGELKIKYLGGATLWGNNAASDWGKEYVLALRPSGVLTVYGPVIWSAKKSFGGEPNIAMVTGQ